MIETLLDKKLKDTVEELDFAIREHNLKKTSKDYLIDVPQARNGGGSKIASIKKLKKRGEIR